MKWIDSVVILACHSTIDFDTSVRTFRINNEFDRIKYDVKEIAQYEKHTNTHRNTRKCSSTKCTAAKWTLKSCIDRGFSIH